MKALDFDASVLDLDKYDPDQPRVPAGSGRESGRWSDGTVSDDNTSFSSGTRPKPSAPVDIPAPRLPIVPVAANGPLEPGGVDVVPMSGIDPLDSKGLNTPLSAVEQQAIADTVNTIIGTRPEDLTTLNPHFYENRPHRLTGARLSSDIDSYTTYYVRKPGSVPGEARLIIDRVGRIYYTNNHYKSSTL